LWRICRPRRCNGHGRRIGSRRHSRRIDREGDGARTRAAQNAGRQPRCIFSDRPVQRAGAGIADGQRLSAWIASALYAIERQAACAQTDRRGRCRSDRQRDGDGLRRVRGSRGCNHHVSRIAADGESTDIGANGKRSRVCPRSGGPAVDGQPRRRGGGRPTEGS